MDLKQVFSELFRIDGLDFWDGLSHVGCSQDVYVDALRLFCRDLEKKSEDLEVFLQKENWNGYTATIHAMKGGLAGIGAWELSAKVKELEDAVQKQDYKLCKRNTPETLKDLMQFTGSLRASVLFVEEKTEREKVLPEYFEKKLGELYQYCSLGNSEKADSLARELKTKTCGGEIGRIADAVYTHVENLDYHLVIQILADKPYIKNR